MVATREAGLPQPACGWCISPWVDMEAIGETMTTRAAADPMVQQAGMCFHQETHSPLPVRHMLLDAHLLLYYPLSCITSYRLSSFQE